MSVDVSKLQSADAAEIAAVKSVGDAVTAEVAVIQKALDALAAANPPDVASQAVIDQVTSDANGAVANLTAVAAAIAALPTTPTPPPPAAAPAKK